MCAYGLSDLSSALPRPLPQVAHQAQLQPGRQPGEQLPDRLPVAGARPAALPVLHHLRGPPQAPLLRTPVLRPVLRPDRQPGLRGHRGPLRVPLPHVQVHPAAGGPRAFVLGLLLRALRDPAAAAAAADVCGEGARESLGMKWMFGLWRSPGCFLFFCLFFNALPPP